MLLALRGGERVPATPDGWATCPTCDEELLPKCGSIVAWHWAHLANDCDPWSEPESQWYLDWKAYASRCEVTMKQEGVHHRADIVTKNNVVVELQHGYLPVSKIRERELFYRRMIWLYDARRWFDRLHFGRYGFWWKHGAKGKCATTSPLYWDIGEEVWRVLIANIGGRVPVGELNGEILYAKTGRHRVLGKVLERRPKTDFIEWLGKQ